MLVGRLRNWWLRNGRSWGWRRRRLRHRFHHRRIVTMFQSDWPRMLTPRFVFLRDLAVNLLVAVLRNCEKAHTFRGLPGRESNFSPGILGLACPFVEKLGGLEVA